MIEPSWAEAHLPLVIAMLQGHPVSFIEREGSDTFELPFAVEPSTMARHELFIRTFYGVKPNPNVPENVVGILPLNGPITKYDGTCGEPGAIQKANWLNQMQQRSAVNSIVLLHDTPGGEHRAANFLTDPILKSKKPVLSFVSGMSASLGMFPIAASMEVYLSTPDDQVGSIGSYMRLPDLTGYLEKQGIKLHEIYAPQSVDKNKNYRDALKGDYKSIEADLERTVNGFVSFVKQHRGDKAAASAKEWNTGKMFYAEDAVKLGLADGVRSFAQVVSKAAWLSKRQK